jgi:TonB-linked SusC/RagA family outer membrane protein
MAHYQPIRIALFLLSFLTLSVALKAQVGGNERTITGVVTDKEESKPLPYVNISVRNDSRGTTSDENGVYTLSVRTGDVLIFSYIGYIQQEITITTQTTLNVDLEPETKYLDDVVIIAYGQVRKSDLTGSVSSISADEIAKTAPVSLDQALQGRAAGVQVTQVSGRPGGETSVRIRGASSINAGNEPLYVIDGMLINTDNGSFNGGGVAGAPLNGLASINPSDIESIEILKDASATALYGSRGSNGVVLITTKRGKEGRSQVNFDSYIGIQQVAKKLDVLDGQTFANYMNAFNADAGLPVDPRYFIPERIGAGTDWQDAIFKEALMQNYQLNFLGGTAKTKYSISAGYMLQDGIVLNSNFERYNVRLNLDQDVKDWLKAGASLSISQINSKGVLTGSQGTSTGVLLPGSTAGALLFPSTLPVLDDRVIGGYTFQDDRGRNLANPVADALETDNLSKNLRAIASTYAIFKLAEGLNFKVNLGADAFAVNEFRYVPNYLKRTEANNGEAVLATVNGQSWLAEYTLNYDKTFNERHQVGALLGNTYQGFESNRLFVYALDFPDNRTGYHNLANALNPQPSLNGEASWGIISYLGRVNYGLDNKYLFTLTGRLDGSSKFGANNKYGFFPSLAFAWKMHEEKFIQNLDVFSSLKARISYGIIGNQEIASFTSLATVGPIGEGVFHFDEIYKGQEPLRYPNPNLRWERTSQFDIGLDMEFIEGRITAVADFYQKNTTDLLLFTPLPATTGFSGFLSNIGGLKNTGIEFAVTSYNFNKGFKWNTTLNFARNRNEITALSSGNDIPVGGVLNIPTGWSVLQVGQSLGTFFGLTSAGIFQSDAEAAAGPVLRGQNARAGDRKYQDINGRDEGGNLTGQPDGVIDEADRSIIGNANPDFTFGMVNSFSYKGFDLSIFVQGVYGNDVVNAYLLEIGSMHGETNILTEYWENRWTPENPNNEYPKVNPSDRNVFSDAIIENGSFLRIKNVTLGYTFNNTVLSKLRMSSLRIYASGNNLHNFTKYRGYDPEVFAFGQSSLLQGIDYGGYPLARTLIFGIQVGL